MTHIDQIPDGTIARLWREHARDLVGLATILVGPADAHDIAVEAFLRAASAADRPEVSDTRAFLMRSVVNRAHDLRRSNERRWRRDLAAVGPASTNGPDSFFDVRRAVSTLSLGQRSVIYFVYWEDRTEADTANLLGVSIGSVRRHLVRARSHLRKALQ
jgi:DNA-directed RNA polymerase specialized sigma24 family protein